MLLKKAIPLSLKEFDNPSNENKQKFSGMKGKKEIKYMAQQRAL